MNEPDWDTEDHVATKRLTVFDEATVATVSLRPGQRVREGDEGRETMPVYLEVDNPTPLSISGRLRTVGGTAKAGEDYEPLDVPIELDPYSGGTSVALTINADERDEADETIGIELSGVDGAQPETVRAEVTIVGHDGVDGSARTAALWASRGLTGIKAKIGYPTVKEDLAVVRAMRAAAGDDMAIMVDYNQTLTPAEACERIRVLDGEGLTWVEEPTLAHDFGGHALVTREVRTPIQCGENWWGTQDLRHAIDDGVAHRDSIGDRFGGGEERAVHAQRVEDALLHDRLVGLPGEAFDHPTGQVEPGVVVGPRRAGRGQLLQLDHRGGDAGQGVVAGTAIREVVARPAAGMREQVLHGDFVGGLLVGQLQFGHVLADRRIEVELAVLVEVGGDAPVPAQLEVGARAAAHVRERALDVPVERVARKPAPLLPAGDVGDDGMGVDGVEVEPPVVVVVQPADASAHHRHRIRGGLEAEGAVAKVEPDITGHVREMNAAEARSRRRRFRRRKCGVVAARADNQVPAVVQLELECLLEGTRVSALFDRRR